MIYMDPSSIGINPLFKSWCNSLPNSMKLKKNFLQKIQNLYD